MDTIQPVNGSEPDISLLRRLAARLERLSADSKWAHRASGVRGQILRTLDRLESATGEPTPDLSSVIHAAFEILSAAARDLA